MMLLLTSFLVTSSFGFQHSFAVSPSSKDWKDLSAALDGRLHSAVPVATPCFPVVNGKNVTVNATACAAVQTGYTLPAFRAPSFSAFMQPQWETCQSTEEKCLLNPLSPTDPTAWTGTSCQQGAIPEYYIDVATPDDVKKAFKFSAKTGIPLSIKNSGHDYKGRSSGKGTLGVYVHNLNSLSYAENWVPEGGKKKYSRTVTMGTGVDFQDLYAFADANNATVLGGYHQTISASGGWVMGGGHSVLSPVYGLGVDRVLQYKIVTPDGVYRTANAYKNKDLFWALRGGGGGTFGVVLESTVLAEPQFKLQVAAISFTGNATTVPEFLKLIVDNSYKWAQEGWGGHMGPSSITNVTPLLTLEQAKASVKPISDYAALHGGTVVIEEMASWQAFFSKYVLVSNAGVGNENTLLSRLIPTTLFTSDEGKKKLTDVLVGMVQQYAVNPYIVVGAPYLFKDTPGATSVTPAWRDSLWQVGGHSSWTFNSTLATIKKEYQIASNITQMLRDITPGSGAYFNEGDVYEKDHETSFWGPNYPALLAIKKKYDPESLLDCWQCVGWKGAKAPRYSCWV